MTQLQYNDTITYREAMDELAQILNQIENDGVDLDELAEKVERASVLIQLCRRKIKNTEMQVKTIIDQLEETVDEEK